MPLATVSSKGQITLPAGARRALGIKTHDRVVVEVSNGAILIRPVRDFFELKGFLGKASSRREEREAMMRAVADHVARKK